MLCMLFKGLFNQGKKSCRCQKNLRNYLNCKDLEMLHYKRLGKWVYRIYTYTWNLENYMNPAKII